MSRYTRIKKQRRERAIVGVMLVLAGVMLGGVVGYNNGKNEGAGVGIDRANAIIEEYMREEYGAEMLENCKADGLENCRIEFDYTDGVITGIEVVGWQKGAGL